MINNYNYRSSDHQPKASLGRWLLTSSVMLLFLCTSSVKAAVVTAQLHGGLWSNANTWVGTAPLTSDDVIIPTGAIVTIDGTTAINIKSLTIQSGAILMWNSTAALTLPGSITINSGGQFYPHSASGSGATINIGGNFVNNGLANLAYSGTVLNFAGSTISGGSASQSLIGTGTFVGPSSTQGIIRNLRFQTTGSSQINTTQTIIVTESMTHSAGSLNTNNKLAIDNTAQVQGVAYNSSVSHIALTGMGSFANDPAIFGESVTPYAASATASLNARIVSGTNVYLVTGGGTFGATAPSHTSGLDNSSGPELLYLGQTGTIGRPFAITTAVAGNQYFYGDNLYTCTIGGAPDKNAPPTSTAPGNIVSGAATYVYSGPACKVTATSFLSAGLKTMRSINVTVAGTGYYNSAPTIAFSSLGGTYTAPAAGVAYAQNIVGATSFTFNKTPIATITGTIDINSNQNASSFYGISRLATTDGGFGYTVDPTFAFNLPSEINLIASPADQGAGYIVAPTCSLSAPTFGTAPTVTPVVSGGKIVSLYITASTTAFYTSAPTVFIGAPTGAGPVQAVGTFPATSIPTVTVTKNSVGTITGFNMTSNGYGYVSAPVCTLATAGSFVGKAMAVPTCRLPIYNLNYGIHPPATLLTNAPVTAGAEVPTNGKFNALTLGTTPSSTLDNYVDVTLPASFDEIALYGSSPLTFNTTTTLLSPNVLNLNGDTLTFANRGQFVSASTTAYVTGYVRNGSVKIFTTGGSNGTKNFPFDGVMTLTTTNNSVPNKTGSTATWFKATQVNTTPTGPLAGGLYGSPVGNRAYQFASNGTFGEAPVLTLNYNYKDGIASTQQQSSFYLGQATSVTGPWTPRSVTVTADTATLSTAPNGNRATSSLAPVTLDSGGYFAFLNTSGATLSSTAKGGLWTDPATWAGGVLPAVNDTVVITGGAVVTLNTNPSVRSLVIGDGTPNSGTLIMDNSTRTLIVTQDVTVNSGGSLLPYSSGGSGGTVIVGGDFTNDGFVNLAVGATTINFAGSVYGGSMNQTMSGSGEYVGANGKGVVANFQVQTTGTVNVANDDTLLVYGNINIYSGYLNTNNGLLKLDNTALVHGQTINKQVASVAVSNMGVGYTSTPVIAGTSVVKWNSAAKTVGQVFTYGSKVWLVTVAGTAGTASLNGILTQGPDSTLAVGATTVAPGGTTRYLCVGTAGNIGQPLLQTVVAGTVYFAGDNLYVCQTAGNIGTTSPAIPTTTTIGAAQTVGTAAFLYLGPAPKAVANYDATSKTLRSITLSNNGGGIFTTTAFAVNILQQTNDSIGAGAVAAATVLQSMQGANASILQRNATATMDTLIMNNDQGASQFSGVGSIYSTHDGLNYATAPSVGFSLPTSLNLLTNGGSGYTSAPTITINGGAAPVGGTLAAATAVVSQGKVVSVYISTAGTGYVTAPTIAISGGGGSGATVSFPSTALPTATATITNGRLTYAVTNPGFGYTSAPTVTLVGGTATTVASGLTARLGLYNVIYANAAPFNFTSPASYAMHNEGFEIPANRKINGLTMGSTTAALQTSGVTLTGNLEIYNASTFSLNRGVLNLGGNTLNFTESTYGGLTSSTTFSGLVSYVSNGSIKYAARGGSFTRGFPFDAHMSIASGTGTLATGSTLTSITGSIAAKPTGTGTVGAATGVAIGSRSFRIQTTPGEVYGTTPTLTHNFTVRDSLNSDVAGLFLGQSASTSGSWSTRAVSASPTTFNTPLGTTGSRTTVSAVTAPASPIVMTGDDYFAWMTTDTVRSLAYDIARTTGITYNSIVVPTATGTLLGWANSTSLDDQTSPLISIPSSTFRYQGQTITGFKVCTNGWIQLVSNEFTATTSTVFGSQSFAIEAASIPNMIAPFYEDLQATTLDNIRYSISSAAVGSRQITIEYNAMNSGESGSYLLDFQVILDEADSSITFNYGSMQGFNNGTFSWTPSYSVGLGGRQISTFPLAGQLLTQQYENSDVFSHVAAIPTFTAAAHRLREAPTCNSSIKFTPSLGYAGGSVPVAAAPSNDDVAGATVVAALSAFPADLCGTYYSSKYATPTTTPAACAGNNDDDVWFKFTANEPSTTIRVLGSGAYRPRVQVFDAGMNPVSCVVGNLGASTIFPGVGTSVDANIAATVGDEYHVRVYHENGGDAATATALFTPGGPITSIILNSFGSGYVQSSSGAQTTPRVTITGGGGTGALATLNLGTTQSALQSYGKASSITLNNGGFGYTSQPTVTIESPDWSGTNEFSLVVFAKAVNDECVDAIELTNSDTSTCVTGQNQLINQTTAAASASGDAAVASTFADDDVWYKFEGTGYNTVTVTGFAGYNAVFQLYDGGLSPGDCGGKSPEGFRNSTAVNGIETGSFTTIPGNTYYVRVYHAAVGSSASTGGKFTICVTSSVPPCLVNPTSPLNGASLCNGTGYTLTWPIVASANRYDVYLDAGLSGATTLISANQVSNSYTSTTPLTPGNYSWRVVPKNNFGAADTLTSCFTWTFVTLDPVVLTTTPGTRCGTGPVILLATGTPGAKMYWYNVATNGVTLSPTVGQNVFSTPDISSNTTFYVQAEVALGSSTCASPRLPVVASVTAAPAFSISGDLVRCTQTTDSLYVTSTLANYDNYQWTPYNDLYVDFACTIQYVGQNLDKVYVRPAAAGSRTYKCNATAFVGYCSNEASVKVTRQPATAIISSSPAKICKTGTAVLALAANSVIAPGTIQWQTSSNIGGPFTDISGATASTYTTPTLTTTQYYQVVLKDAAAGNVCFTTAVFTMEVIDPQPTSTVAGSRCGTGTVVMSAVGAGQIRWYLASAPNSLLSSDGSYTTTSITAPNTSNYLVSLTVDGCEGTKVAITATATTNATEVGITNGSTVPLTVCNNSITALSPTTNAGSYSVFTWSPTTALYTDASATVPYVGGSASTVYVRNTTSGSITYTMTASNASSQGCIDTATVVINTMPVPTISSNPTGICTAGGTAVLSLTPSTGYGTGTIQWQSSSSLLGVYADIVGQTGTTYTTPAIGATTYYQAVIKNSSGVQCVIAGPYELQVNSAIAVNITADQSVCNNEIVQLSVLSPIGNFSTYSWTPTTGLFIDPAGLVAYTGTSETTVYVSSTTSSSTKYFVNASSPNGCTAKDSSTVVRAPATATVTSVPAFICNGGGSGTAVLSINPSATYASGSIQWQSAPTLGGTYTDISGANATTYTTPTISTTSYYRAMVRNADGDTCITTAPYTLLVNTLPTFTLTASQTVCNSAIVALTITPTSGTFDNTTWSPSTGLFTDAAATIPYTGGNATTVYAFSTAAGSTVYTVNANSANGCANTTTSTTVTRLPAAVTMSATPDAICGASGTTTLSLLPVTGFTYAGSQWQTSTDSSSWSNIGAANATTITTGTITQKTYFRTFILNSAGDTCLRPNYSLNLYQPLVTGALGATRCGTGTVNLTAFNTIVGFADSVKWYAVPTGGVALFTGSVYNVNVTATKSYYAQAFAGSCISARTEVIATVTTNPTLTVSSNQVICDGGFAQLNITSPTANFDNYSWTPQAGLYLDASLANPYLGTNEDTVFAYINDTVVFTVSATTVGGCSRTASIQVIEQESGASAVSNSPSAGFCVTGSATITLDKPFPNGSVLWQSSTDNITFTDIADSTRTSYVTGTLTATTYFRADVKNSAGVHCYYTNSDTVLINNPQPVVTPGSRCGTGDVNLTATGPVGSTITWYQNATGGTALLTGTLFKAVNIQNSTDYYVALTVNGCQGTRVLVTATVNPSPILSITSGKATCNNTPTMITVTSPLANYNTYTWTGVTSLTNLYTDAAATTLYTAGSNQDTVYLRDGIPGNYTFTVNASNATCFITTSSTFTVQPTVGATLSSVPDSICINGTAVLGLSTTTPSLYGIGTISWFGSSDNVTFNLIPGAVFPTYTTLPQSTTRYYKATVTSPDGVCGSSNAYQLDVRTPLVTSLTPATICGPGLVTLNATGSAGTQLYWYANPTGGTALIDSVNSYTDSIVATTTYYVEAVNGLCLSGRNSIVATVTPSTPIDLSPNVTVCNGVITPLSVVTGVGYTNFEWTPQAGLYTDAAATNAYLGGSATTLYHKDTVAKTTTYVVNATGLGCQAIDSVKVTMNPDSINLVLSKDRHCLSGSTVITVTPVAGFSFAGIQWQNSPDNITFTDIAGAVGNTYTTPNLSTTTYYRATLKNSANVMCTIVASDTIVVDNPSILSTVGATQCGATTATLSAVPSAGANVNWFTAPTGGLSIAANDTLITPVISSTTNYYVEATSGAGSIGGLGNLAIPPSSGFNVQRGLQFNAFTPFTLVSTQYYSTTLNVTNTATVILQNSALATIATATIPVAQGAVAGWYTLPLNFNVPAGNGYRLLCTFSTSVSAATTGVNYSSPTWNNLSSAGIITSGVESGGALTSTAYYYFHNWTIIAGCTSPRTPVTVTVTPSPAITASAPQTICNNGGTSISAILGAPGDYDTFTWSPTVDLYTDNTFTTPYTGQNLQTVYVKSDTTGTLEYTVAAFNSTTLCNNIANASVVVNPPSLSMTASVPAICYAGATSLTVSPIAGFSLVSLIWESSNDGITYAPIVPTVIGGTYNTPILTATRYFRASVKNSLGATCVSVDRTILVTAPAVLTTTPDTICGIGTATLSATVTPGSTINWYAANVGGTPLFNNYVNVPVTGFNNDIVAGGLGDTTISGTTYPAIGIDGQRYSFIDNTFKYVASSALPTCFMPVNKLATSTTTPGLVYQFQDYGVGATLNNNALSLTNTSTTYTSPLPNTGTLTLTTPASYGALTVLYESVRNVANATTVDATVTFTDATTEVFPGNTTVNWFDVVNPAYSGMGRTTPTGTIQCGTTPNMFEFRFPISQVNQAKLVQSITFTMPTVVGGGAGDTTAATVNYFHAMAVGGTAPAPVGSFTTPELSVTKDYFVSSRITTEQTAFNGVPVLDSIVTNAGIQLTISKATTLVSADVYSTTANNIQVVLQNSAGVTLQGPKAFSVPAGSLSTPYTLNLGWNVPVASGYRLLVISQTNGTSEGLGYHTGTFSVQLGDGVGTITNGFANGATNPLNYYFYNLKTTTICESPRVLVSAVVTPAPALTSSATQTVCNDAVATIVAGHLPGDYDSYTWSPLTGLYADAAGTIPLTTVNQSNDTVYARTTTAGTSTYIVTALSSGAAACSTKDTSSVVTLPSSFTISGTPPSLCSSGSTTLTVNPITGVSRDSIVWYTSLDGISYSPIIPSAKGASYTTPIITDDTTYYRAVFVNSLGATCVFADYLLLLSDPQVVSVVNGTRCGIGSVDLTAVGTAGSVLNWFADSTGGAAIATGATFATPTIAATDTFYVSAGFGSSISTATVGTGTLVNTLSSTTTPTPYFQYYGSYHEQYMIRASELTAMGLVPGNISSLAFDLATPYASTNAPQQNFQIFMAGTSATDMSTFISTGFTNVYNAPGPLTPSVGWNNYPFTSNFYWDGVSNIVVSVMGSNCSVCNGTSVCTTSFTNSGIVNQTATSFVSGAKNFADGNCTINSFAISGGSRNTFSLRPNMRFNIIQGCFSDRSPVIATVTTPPAITAAGDTSVCSAQPVTVSASSANANYTYNWGGALNGSSVVVNPTTDTSYVVLATDTVTLSPNFGCATTDTVRVAINVNPTTPNITPSDTMVCAGTALTLLVTNPDTTAIASLQIGGGTGTAATSGVSPYGGFWEGGKVQYLYRASELLARGYTAGNIYDLRISTPTSMSVPLTNFTMSLGHTTATELATGYITSGLTPVFTSPAYQPIVGLNKHTFSTPFNWDGTSNIVVDICFDNDAAGTCVGGSGVCYSSTASTSFTTTSFVSVRGNYGDNGAAPRLMCDGLVGTSVTSSDRPNMIWSATADSLSPSTYVWNGSTTAYEIIVAPSDTTTYNVVATNDFGCSITSQRTINVVPRPAPKVDQFSQVLCPGEEIFIGLDDTLAYATSPYPVGTLVDWYGAGGVLIAANQPTTTTLSSTLSSEYYATVKIPNACQVTSNTISITSVPLALSTTFTQTSCSGNDGSITATVIGAGPFTYEWRDGSNNIVQTVTNTSSNTNTLSGIATGTYSVVVIGNVGAVNPAIPSCSTAPVYTTVTGAVPFTVNVTGTNETCPGDLSGSAIAQVTPAGSYSYSWNSGAYTTQQITGVAPGIYNVVVTNTVTGCTNSGTYEVIAAPSFTFDITSTNASCGGALDGGASVTFGGTATLAAYAWIDGPDFNTANVLATDGDLIGVGAGTYYVYVTDGNCFQYSAPVVITEPALITVTTFTPSNATVGTTISINGTGFTGATGVSFNGTPAVTFTVHTSDSITAVVPVGATTGNVTVFVGACSGTSTAPFTVDVPAFTTLNLKAYIEGYYIVADDSMVAVNYNIDGVSPSNETDSIIIELYEVGDPTTVVESATVMLKTDGTTSFDFSPAIAASGTYYIAIRGRNIVETWSLNAIDFSSTTDYDFSTASTQAYDDGLNLPMKEVTPGVWALYSGDINQDGSVDGLDMNEVETDAGNLLFGYQFSDVTGDGASDGLDMNVVEFNSGLLLFEAHP